jgi:uncharacterized protein (TIGR03790 family)
MRRLNGSSLTSALWALAQGLAYLVAPTVTSGADQATAAPSPALSARQLAVIVNTADPLSVAIGQYYIQRRHIPEQNVSRVSFDYHRVALSAGEFAALKSTIDQALPPSVQAYALTWAMPYRVDCMSITSAFAFGFDKGFCATGCGLTQISPYYDSDAALPYKELHLRPTMSIAAVNFEQAKRLIDRGLASDGTAPSGTAYLVSTGDPARDVRISDYADVLSLASDRTKVVVVESQALVDRTDVMFYFIGASQVQSLTTNRFLPGAVADHLTSLGGQLTDSTQMSSLRWLEAGATGSYGAVVEPCNFPAKFPHPGILMRHYLAGESLIEAYWKSVAMPGQGVFIGEPLASPYRIVRKRSH